MSRADLIDAIDLYFSHESVLFCSQCKYEYTCYDFTVSEKSMIYSEGE